jgi:uncharacterized membrane protein
MNNDNNVDSSNDNIDKDSLGKIRLDHVISFGDAIFAFSITFMAISIEIPNLPTTNLTVQQIVATLSDLQPQLEIYAISFMIVGIYWISYHRVFNHIRSSHSILVWLNLLFLFFVTLISFATNIDLKYGNFQFIFLIYAGILTITGATLAIIWLHASKANLLAKSITKLQGRLMLYDLLIPVGIFLISIGISFIDIQVAQYFWILIIVAKIVARKKYPKSLKYS